MYRLRRAGGIFTIIAVLISGLFFWYLIASYDTMQRAEPINLSDDVALELVSVLTHDNPVHSHLSLTGRVFMLMPEWVQLKTRKWWDFSGNWQHKSIALQQGKVECLLKIQFPKDWLKLLSHDDISTRLNELKDTDEGHLWARIDYGNGFYSTSEVVNFTTYQSINSSRFMVERLIFALPANALKPTLEIFRRKIKQSSGASLLPPSQSELSVGKLPFRNPLQRVSALPKPKSLPHSLHTGNLQINLISLVGQVSENARTFNNKSDSEMVETENYPANKPGELSTTFVAFEVLEHGQAADDWLVLLSNFHYGREHIPFDIEREREGRISNYRIFQIRPDLRALEQPVEMTVSLIKQEGLGEDEREIIELPVPAKGESIAAQTPISFWNGEVNVWLSNQKHSNKPIATSPNYLTLAVTKLRDHMTVIPKAARLELPDGKEVDLYGNSAYTHVAAEGIAHNFDFKRAMARSKIDPSELDKGSTFVVELTSPYRVNNLKFIAEPTAARGSTPRL